MILNASNNIRNGIKSVRLFELGTVVDKNRNESTKLTFLFSGNVEDNALINNDKPKQIDFLSFANAISKVIGNFEVKSDTTTSKLFNPYEFGKVIIDNKEVGLISSLHINETNKLDLPATYICELNFDALNFQRKLYTQASKYQAVDRNLSLLVPKNLPFKKIKTFISSFTPSELINFYPVDIFESEELKENLSLTVKFIYQSNEKTLTDEDVNGIEKEILEKLDSEMGVGIR
jgi:phenylalanyl-tRNA synthetase beta chain